MAVNVPGVPLVIVTSDASKPVTVSPNWNVNVTVPAFVTVPSGVMTRVGVVRSDVTVAVA